MNHLSGQQGDYNFRTGLATLVTKFAIDEAECHSMRYRRMSQLLVFLVFLRTQDDDVVEYPYLKAAQQIDVNQVSYMHAWYVNRRKFRTVHTIISHRSYGPTLSFSTCNAYVSSQGDCESSELHKLHLRLGTVFHASNSSVTIKEISKSVSNHIRFTGEIYRFP